MKLNNIAKLDGVIYHRPTFCTEAQTFRTSRFHSYDQITTWKPIVPAAVTHHQTASYVLTHQDYLSLSQAINQFSDRRFPNWIPEYGLTTGCAVDGNEITLPDLPWSFINNSFALLVVYDMTYVIQLHQSAGNTLIAPRLQVDAAEGVLIPLRRGVVVSPTNISTNLRSVEFQVRYEFDKPRDYTQADRDYTTSDFPRPRVSISEVVSLPDFQFAGHRVRGRRDFNRPVGWGHSWGNAWGGQSAAPTATKDYRYQARYVDSLDVRYDYIIKNVVAKSLTTASLIGLPDTNLARFPAMLEQDSFSVSYNRFSFNTSLSYSKRTLKPQPVRVGWGNNWGVEWGN